MESGATSDVAFKRQFQHELGVSEEVRMKLSDHTSPAVNQLYT